MNMPAPSGTSTGEARWRENLIEDSAGIRALLEQTQRIAVLGMRDEEHAAKPAFYVPRYLLSAGFEVIPVPVHHPAASSILGQKAYRNLTDIPGEIDLVDVFHQSEEINEHLEDILAKGPAAVWFQSGIRNMSAAERLARAGIKVVQDRCLMIEHRRVKR